VADERFDESRLDGLLGKLETRARPDEAFADRLFDRLATDVGFRQAAASAAPGGSRWWPWRAAAGSMRLAWLAVLGAAVLALLSFGLLATGGPRLGPNQLGQASPTVSLTPAATAKPTRTPAPTPVPLVVGQPAPSWAGTLIDGRPFSTEDLLGRPAAIFFWCVCASGPEVRAFLDEAGARSDTMNSLLVSLDELGTTTGLVDWLDVRTPVLLDQTWELFGGTWEIGDTPALVLLDADGTVVDVRFGYFGEQAEQLPEILDAFESGAELPEPAPLPTPGYTGDPPLSTVLDVGVMAPELRGPRLGGGEVSTRDFLGRPTVVLDFRPGISDDAPPPVAVLADLKTRSGLDVLLIAHGERVPGGTEQILDASGVDYPVLFDWDGTLFERWGLVYWPTLILLDAEGRVAGWYGYSSVANPTPLLDLFEAGEPLPSPPPVGPDWPF
jgi:peroxiredoxin